LLSPSSDKSEPGKRGGGGGRIWGFFIIVEMTKWGKGGTGYSPGTVQKGKSDKENDKANN